MSPSPQPAGTNSGWALALLGVLVLVLAQLAPPAARAQATPPAGWIEVERNDAEAGARWSVVAIAARLEEVVRAIARHAGLALEGAELIPAAAEVSIQLASRPLGEVLTLVLGTGGLHGELAGGTLRVQAEADAPAALFARADAAWAELGALTPGPAGAAARLARGALAEARGDERTAVVQYTAGLEEELARAGDAPEDATLELLYHAGLARARQGDWTTAARHFRRLGAQGGALFRTRAHLALAHALLELGDAQGAASALEALDVTGDACAAAERRLLRARACLASAQPEDTLRVLDAGPEAPVRGAEARSFALRAEALATLGHPSAAAWAWLVFAHEGAVRPERPAALARAAELALESGDALAALFVCREAEALGLAPDFAILAQTARERLGLAASDARIPFAERIALAEALLELESGRAAQLLEGLEREQESLSPLERALLFATRAKLVALREGSARALALLAEARATLDAPEARQTLDKAAASLLESEDRFGAAADAYRGRY